MRYRYLIPLAIVLMVFMVACTPGQTGATDTPTDTDPTAGPQMTDTSDTQEDDLSANAESDDVRLSEPVETRTAILAAGCFWCSEAEFEKVPGVLDVVSGYTGGDVANPTYEQVSRGQTKHIESVLITYDPSVVSYQELLDTFFFIHDPTDEGGSFADRGYQYSSAIFYGSDEELSLAKQTIARLEAEDVYGGDIVTLLIPRTTFYEAEEYHQDYYKKSAQQYLRYRDGSGRSEFIEEFDEQASAFRAAAASSRFADYVKPSDAQLKELLTPIQYKVTQEDGTETPFDNEYDTNKEPGIYVDILSGEPLFSSTDKYDSGTGWPSFTKPLVEDNIVTRTDFKLVIPRTEVRSRYADNHIGHVFKDGPAPTGLRYCMNSAALRFIPADELEAQGYGEFVYLFQ